MRRLTRRLLCRENQLFGVQRLCTHSRNALCSSSELTSELKILCDQIVLYDVRRFLQRDVSTASPSLPSLLHGFSTLMSSRALVGPSDLFQQHQLMFNFLLPWLAANTSSSSGKDDELERLLLQWIDTLCRIPRDEDALRLLSESSLDLGVALLCALKTLRSRRRCECQGCSHQEGEGSCLARDVVWITVLKKAQQRLVTLPNGAQRLLTFHCDLSRDGGLAISSLSFAKHPDNSAAMQSCNRLCVKLLGLRHSESDFTERLTWLDGRDQFERMPEATLHNINRQLSSISCR